MSRQALDCYRFLLGLSRLSLISRSSMSSDSMRSAIASPMDEVNQAFGFVDTFVFIVEIDKQPGSAGNCRVYPIGDLPDVATPFLAVDNPFVYFEMPQRSVIHQPLVKTAQVMHYGDRGHLAGLEFGELAHRYQYLLPLLQEIIDGMGLSGTTIFFGRNFLGYLGYFVYL
jgi:hypothetical protein